MKMKSIALVATTALALSGAPAVAQQAIPQGGQGAGSPPGDSSSSGKGPTTAGPGNEPAAPAAATFVRDAALGAMAGVEIGRLATERAASAEVKHFAQRMVADHGRSSGELKTLAQHKDFTLPTELDAAHKQTRDRLATLSGAAFDRAYMDVMRTDHRKDVEAFRQQSRSGRDPDVKAFAAKSLPTLESHLQLAERTHAAVGTSGIRSDRDRPDRSDPTGTGRDGSRPGDRDPAAPQTGAPGSGTHDPRHQPGPVPGSGIGR